MPEDEKPTKPQDLEDKSADNEPDTPLEPVAIPKNTPQEPLQRTYDIPVKPAPKNVIIKRLIILFLVLILIAAVGFAAWKFLINKKDNTSSQTNQNQSLEEPQSQNSETVSSALTETYTSDFLRLDFKYPTGWEVTEDNISIVAKSPNFQYEENNGSEANGFFKIYIKKGATNENDSKYLGRGYAIEPSEKIAYFNPAAGQRKDTYLTNFGLDNPDNFAYFVVQGNFNIAKGDTLGPKFASEPDSYLIAGGFAVDADQEGLAIRQVSMDFYKDNQAYKTAIEIVKTLQLK